MNPVNAQIHPTVAGFFNLNRQRIVLRYCHLHPAVSEELLETLLDYRPSHFHWAGSDLFIVTNAQGTRQCIIIETNSCPSGQKSMPLLQDTDEYGGYRKVTHFPPPHLLRFLTCEGDRPVCADASHRPQRMGRTRRNLGQERNGGRRLCGSHGRFM